MTTDLMLNLLYLNHDYNQYIVGNDTMRGAFVTQIFSEMLNMM